MATAGVSRNNTVVILLMGAVLIWGAVSAITVPAGEFPPSPYHIVMLGLDVLITAILAVLVAAERSSPSSGLKSASMAIGALGVLAGLVQIGIRFTSDHAWWTGHYSAPVFN